MTYDYKNVMHSRGPSPIMWLWLLAIVSVGSFVSLLFYLDQYDRGKLGTDHAENLKQLFIEQQSTVSGRKTPEKENPGQSSKKNQYDFYDLLPSMEVIIPGREVAVRDDEVPMDPPKTSSTEESKELPLGLPKKIAPTASRASRPDTRQRVTSKPASTNPANKATIHYVLQAGSFRDPGQAEKLKAGLALLGIKSAIEKVRIKNSGQWHRVRIGPFTAMRDINKVRSHMRANNIEPILLKDKS